MRHLFVAATLAAALPFPAAAGQFEKISLAAKGRVGVAAQLLESRETASLHGDEHFPMHSVYKLAISMAVFTNRARDRYLSPSLIHTNVT
jgi:beta-lactamase class A